MVNPLSYFSFNSSVGHPMKDRSDDPSHHELTLLPRSYISLRSDNTRNQICYLGHNDTGSVTDD